jgi:hypothetical protein
MREKEVKSVVEVIETVVVVIVIVIVFRRRITVEEDKGPTICSIKAGYQFT